MPELPEVETTRRGIAPHVVGRRISRVIVRDARLRRPVSKHLVADLVGQRVTAIDRRGKYILLRCKDGTLIVHLGMSGSLRLVKPQEVVQKHDHVDIIFDGGRCLRLRDPRRFGLMEWTRDDPLRHGLLKDIGPEPLEAGFSGAYLCGRARGRKSVIKTFIMDSHIVVGVGNIYASEALFRAGINPMRAAGRISCARYERLAAAIKQVLRDAIRQGGTTLRDFVNGEGRPGYFRAQLDVYGRAGEPCRTCGRPIKQCSVGQRSTYYCSHCQR